jgi:hypothetical protein
MFGTIHLFEILPATEAKQFKWLRLRAATSVIFDLIKPICEVASRWASVSTSPETSPDLGQSSKSLNSTAADSISLLDTT